MRITTLALLLASALVHAKVGKIIMDYCPGFRTLQTEKKKNTIESDQTPVHCVHSCRDRKPPCAFIGFREASIGELPILWLSPSSAKRPNSCMDSPDNSDKNSCHIFRSGTVLSPHAYFTESKVSQFAHIWPLNHLR